MSLESVLTILSDKEGYEDLGRGASSAEVVEVERRLEVDLPPDYTTLLTKCGYVAWFGHSIFGISPVDEFSVVANTVRARNMELPVEFEPLPSKAVVVKTYAGGGWYVLRCQADRFGQVSLLTDDEMGSESMWWSSFDDFLEWAATGTQNWRT